MREIVFDTETTGLDPADDRIIELGCLELDNRFPTGRVFHVFINPEGRAIHPDAQAVHGISSADLADKPAFKAIADDFLAFADGARLIAHNANFDIGFVNAELGRIEQPPVEPFRVVDTLAIARRKHPMGPNSLDALCKRYGIDNSRRTKHGALLDAELLAEVYIELIGGKQAALGLDAVVQDEGGTLSGTRTAVPVRERPRALPTRLTQEERAAHSALVQELGESSMWVKSGLAGL